MLVLLVFVFASTFAQQACTKLKGSCIAITNSACAGGTWKTGLCPGANRCCIPASSAPAPVPGPRVDAPASTGAAVTEDGIVVFRKGEAGYDEAVLYQNTMGSSNPQPSKIFYPESIFQVQKIVRANQNQAIAVRAGRHSYALTSSSNGIVIDVGKLTGLEINAAAKTATVQTGNTNFDIQNALSKQGFMVPLGTCPSVGAGFFLGGGYSLASRLLGMGVDHVISAQVVVGNGDLIEANANANADLFWAIRGGGGGGLGVVVSLTLSLAPYAKEVTLNRFEWEDGVAALTAWEDFLIAQLSNKKVVPQGFTNPNVPGETQAPWVALSGYVTKKIGKAKWQLMVDEMKKRVGVLVIIDPHGGAINDVPASATAYAHRDRLYHFQIMAYFGSDAARGPSQQKIEDFYNFLVAQGICDGGAYINYPNLAMKKGDWGRLYYGQSWERLVQVKAKYDPNNVFNHALSIPTSLTGSAPSAAVSTNALPSASSSAGSIFDGVTAVAADNTVTVPDCAKGAIKLRLNEVESGAKTVLGTVVSVCHQAGRGLQADFVVENWPTQPTYLTNGCNDNVNPPYKSDAVEIFIGFANEQSKLTDYFEAEFSPKEQMWLGKITNIPGTAMKTVNPQCSTSGVQVKVTQLGNAPAGRTLWQYRTTIPFSIVPGFQTATTLYGTFLRIGYTNPQFTNPKELSSATAHGKRNFHMPQRFLKLNLAMSVSDEVKALAN